MPERGVRGRIGICDPRLTFLRALQGAVWQLRRALEIGATAKGQRLIATKHALFFFSLKQS